MPAPADFNEPAYISSHSADVILSDIRPFKLKSDALRSINLFLDEFLYNVLSSSGSLSTDRLRASLLGLLPTSLGKEALLEAEVELRAYWERTAPAGVVPSLEDDSAGFHLPWSFELLRNKCEAYSTLNEADEDPAVEGKINDKYGRAGASAPRALLVAPAALYLTAIIEAVCEHILSNVGRVAARDSSRASATVNDLFTALCEDASVYGYFKTTKVYHQIEQLSNAPKISKRSTSISHARSNSASRQSFELPPTTPSSRSSFDKSRALRMFANGKTSDQETQSTHKKSVSMTSEKNGSVHESEVSFVEDAAMLAEFDDLMRSASTMKVSLTPDRLRTMEVYKQEKEQRGNRRPTALTFKPEPEAKPTSRPSSQKQAFRPVDSIVEDEEEGSSPRHTTSPGNRTRQGSVTTIPNVATTSPNGVRTRSISTSSASRNLARSPSGTMPSSFPAKAAALATSSSTSNLHKSYVRDSRPRGMTESGLPTRTRVKQRNRESMDLDDVMGGSDDEAPPNPPGLQPQGAAGGVPPKRVPKVSSTTRELMDFLAEGPPDDRGTTAVSREGKQLMDFLAEGPPTYGNGAASQDPKPKAGRLQRMISKLNIGDKPKAPESPVKAPTHRAQGSTGLGQHISQSNGLSSLANRPIPPRPPRPPQPISPPSSPSQASLVEERSVPSRQASGTFPQPPNGTATHQRPPPPPPPVTQPMVPPKSQAPFPSVDANVGSDGRKESHAPRSPATPSKSGSGVQRKPVPIVHDVPTSSTAGPSSGAALPGIISESDARDMRRLISSATTTDECRLIVDMFLTRAGITTNGSNKASDVSSPYPSPPPSVNKYPQGAVTASDGRLEDSVVGLLLSGSGSSTPPTRPSRRQRPPKADEHAEFHSQEVSDRQIPVQEVFARPPPVPVAAWKAPTEFIAHGNSTPITAAS